MLVFKLVQGYGCGTTKTKNFTQFRNTDATQAFPLHNQSHLMIKI